VTKEQIDALLKLLDKPGVGMNDRDAVHKLQSTHLLVISVPILCPQIEYSILFSALERIEDMLRVVSDRVDNAGHLGRDDGKVVSELLVEIRAAVNDCQVSSKAGSAVQIANENRDSLSYLRPPYLVNRLHPRRGPVSDVTS